MPRPEQPGNRFDPKMYSPGDRDSRGIIRRLPRCKQPLPTPVEKPPFQLPDDIPAAEVELANLNEILASAEKPLAGPETLPGPSEETTEAAPKKERKRQQLLRKVAVVSGSRGIAKGAIVAMAREGVSTVFALHTGTKPKKVRELLEAVAAVPDSPTVVIPVKCDITNRGDLKFLQGLIKRNGGKVDIAYHDAAGGYVRIMKKDSPKEIRAKKRRSLRESHKINNKAKVALTEALAPFLTDDAVVINIESPQSEYEETDIRTFESYDPVAKGKHAGKIAVARVVDEINQRTGKRIRHTRVLSTLVAETITGDMLEHALGEGAIATFAGKISIDEAGEAVLKAALAEHGHTEVVGIDHWGKERVKDELDMFDETTRKAERMVAVEDLRFAHYHLQEADMQPLVAPERIRLHWGDDFQQGSPDASVVFEEFDVTGHFVGGPGIVRAVQQLALAGEVVKANANAVFEDQFHLVSIDGMSLKRAVFPGEKVDVYLEFISASIDELKYNVVEKVGDAVVSEYNGLTVRRGEDPTDPVKPMLVEIAAQTALLDGAQRREAKQAAKADEAKDTSEAVDTEEKANRPFPLFRGTRKIVWHGGPIKAGDETISQSKMQRATNLRVLDDITIFVGDEKRMSVERLDGAMLPRAEAMTMLNSQRQPATETPVFKTGQN